MIKNYLRSFKHFINNIRDIFINSKKIDIINPNETIFVMLAADYFNLGDVAITYAQKEFLKTNFKKKTIIEIPVGDTCKVFLDMKKKINENTIITLIGGGNTGDNYELIERYRRFIIRNFSKNKIISFPQTCDFSNNSYGKYSLHKSIRSYAKNKNLVLVARENITYNFYKENFHNDVIITPDIVLSLSYNEIIKKSGICLLLRDDKEKKLDVINYNNLLEYLNNTYSDVVIKDTCIKNFCVSKKYEQLFELLDEIKTKKLVITDRLHGMIFCYITKTPCIVFPNSNHKIIKTYENWLKECNYIKLIKSFDLKIIKECINDLYNLKSKIDKNNLDEKYDILRNHLKKM